MFLLRKMESKIMSEEKNIHNNQETQLNEQVQTAMASPAVPKIYANGYIIGQTVSDSFILLQQNGHPISILNLSFTAAKSLSIGLKNMIEQLESDTGQSIMTTDLIKSKTQQ